MKGNLTSWGKEIYANISRFYTFYMLAHDLKLRINFDWFN